MAEKYFDRYGAFRVDGKMTTIPFIKLDEKPTDEVVQVLEDTRFDKLSQKYYGNGKHGFLILQANPSYGGLEFDIPKGVNIRIPFPLDTTIMEYRRKVIRHIELYGL